MRDMRGMRKDKPSLGHYSEEILGNAIEYPNAGYLLKFESVFNGHYYFNHLTNKFRKITNGGLTYEEMPVTFEEDTMLGLISRGEIGIFITSGKHYRKEIHRADGLNIVKRLPKLV